MSSCAVCIRPVRSRVRDMSATAVAQLISTGEMAAEHVGQPVCDDCFSELRDVLIEVEEAAAAHAAALAALGSREGLSGSPARARKRSIAVGPAAHAETNAHRDSDADDERDESGDESQDAA